MRRGASSHDPSLSSKSKSRFRTRLGQVEDMSVHILTLGFFVKFKFQSNAANC